MPRGDFFKTIKETKELVSELAKKTEESLQSLLNRIESLEKKQDNPINLTPATSPNFPLSTFAQPTNIPIPMEYREIVNQTLNRHFGIVVEPETAYPGFKFTIEVPKEYSSLPLDEFDFRNGDKRTKVINYAEGVFKIKEFCDRIYNTFASEMKAKIIQERI